MRRAFHEEGDSFYAWLSSLQSGEPEQVGPSMADAEMPDIPIAGEDNG